MCVPKGKNAKRIRLAEAQNWRCAYCSGLMHDDGMRLDGATIEHIVPIILGGGRDRDNLVSACLACNGTRSAFYSARAFYRIRRWLLRKGRWPPCTYPSKKVRKRLLIIFAEAEQLRALKLSAQPEAAAPESPLRPRWPERSGAVQSETAAAC